MSRILVVILIGLSLSVPVARAGDLLIRDVTIVSPERREPLKTVNVLLRDGRIFRIMKRFPQNHEGDIVDGSGRFLVPGLIDSHVHLASRGGLRGDQARKNPGLVEAFRRQEPRSYLFFGFTTVIDMNVSESFADRWQKLKIRPDLEYCQAAPFSNGYGMAFEPAETRFEAPNFLYDPEQADAIPSKYPQKDHTPEAVVARISATGAICIKTYYEPGFAGLFDWPVPGVDIVRRVAREANRNHLVHVLHANSFGAQRVGSRARVPVMGHGLWHWDEFNGAGGLPAEIRKVLDQLVAEGVGFQTTARVIFSELDLHDAAFIDRPELSHAVPAKLVEWYRTDEAHWFREELLEIYRMNPDVVRNFLGREPTGHPTETTRAAISQLRRVVAHLNTNGAKFLLGSDTPSSPTYTNSPGLNGWLELRALAHMGLSLKTIFRAATINNARVFGLDDQIGTIEKGKKANLLLLEENPLTTIEAYNSISVVFLNGMPIERDRLSATNSPSDHPR